MLKTSQCVTHTFANATHMVFTRLYTVEDQTLFTHHSVTGTKEFANSQILRTSQKCAKISFLKCIP